ncbi:MAG: tRNA (cytidine(34)-2'-O)-methyltransferase [Rhodospirillales bacterium]|jgi:tRNA (cytidine/uridine-2'-O-)-methyltransferase|nr:tRNA methyltransferase [Rhodospirillaceae bacterium]MDP6429586.1 tRNA (cytidine(34)-2'-O)-methyltransferase [Rhodospirillales bacterium]MDP6643883.1 tRNA (cytidine(34)-2'-O)-methyltransferase [Rhodospirillales bacterium]MDP6841806.1 tRNA (cytidine(34)-2'-O)-methyltransferase [Rhodospirillales bacterium]
MQGIFALKPDLRPRLALFEPDIPQNTGAMLRLCACLNVAVDVIEPCGFVFGDRRLRRAGMDYADRVQLERHASWADFQAERADSRLILMTTKAITSYTDFAFRGGDSIIMGSESAGVPDVVHEAVDARLIIPLAGGMRSLNVAQAAAMVLGEALRQLNGFAELGDAPDSLETAR